MDTVIDSPPAMPAVRLRGVRKTYGDVVANAGVDLEIRSGSIHGLLGENGAGKSTLMKVLYGLTAPDAGTIQVGGVERRLRSPADAIATGVGMVQQHFSLIDDFTVAENIVLGREPRRRRVWFDRPRAEAEVAAVVERHGFRLDPRARVGDLAVGARQRVEILKCLHQGAEVVILDEPTAALAPGEIDGLFGVLRSLRAGGRTVVLISHKLPEVIDLCDRVTALRAGRVAGEREITQADRTDPAARQRLEHDLATLVVGSPLPAARPVMASSAPDHAVTGPVLSLRAATDTVHLAPLDLDVHPGEIVGIAGVEGNGQTELAELLVGVRRCRTGTVTLDGRDVTRLDVAGRLAAGLAHIAEDRHVAGVALALSVADNAGLGFQDDGPRAGRFRPSTRRLHRHAATIVEHSGARVPSLHAPIAHLSGGNQQKLVVGRELARGPALMLAAQPTRGLDLAAAAHVHDALRQLAATGRGVILLSLDLAEILAVAHRVVVMSGGALVGSMPTADVDVARISAWMTGVTG